MSKRYCTAFFVLCATLVACTANPIPQQTEPPCLVHATQVTAGCQRQLDALARQRVEYTRRLERQRTANGILASLSVGAAMLLLVFVAVEVKARYQNRVGAVALQLHHQQHELAVLRVAGANATNLASASRQLPQPVPHTLTITHNPNNSRTTTFTDGRKFSSRHQVDESQPLQLHQEAAPSPLALPTAEYALHDPELIAGYTAQGERIAIHPKIIMAGGGIGGGMGSGKSSLMLWLAAQMCLKYSARLIVIDPHKGVGEEGECLSDKIAPLAPYLECEAIGYDEMCDGLALVNSKLQERLRPPKNQPRKVHHPLLILVDEFVSLLQSEFAEEMRQLGQTTSQQTRKVNAGALYASHIWKKGVVGDMGYTIPTHGICRTSLDMAKIQTGASRSQLPPEVEALCPGQFLWRDFRDLEFKRLNIPELPAELVFSLAQQYTEHERLQQSGGSHGKAIKEADKSASQPAKILNPEDARIVDLIQQGKSTKAIAKAVFSVSGGRKYGKVTTHINSLREVA